MAASLSLPDAPLHSLPLPRGPSVFPPSPITPRHFLGVLPPPKCKAPPRPRRPQLPPPPVGWTRSYHAAPAAYPKQMRESHGSLRRSSFPHGNARPVPGESKEARKARVESAVKKVVDARANGDEWSLEDAAEAAPEGLFVVLERWTRDVPTGGHTVICTHPNGTQKEHWHPTLNRILARADEGPSAGVEFGTGLPLGREAEVLIDDIWMMDHWNHGESVDLNDGYLGPVEVWDDVGRDILNFIVHVLPTAKTQNAASLPWQLEWAAEGTAPAVRVMGFGGSYGGLGHVMAAHTRPDVYHGIFLADTLIQPRALDALGAPPNIQMDIGMGRVRAAMKRRDAWPSRAEAGKTWLKLPFYQAWHPEVFALTLSHGLVRVLPDGETDTKGNPDVDDAPVVLATPTWAEASVFIEPMSSGRAWDMLGEMQVPVAFLVAQNRFPERLQAEMTWRPPLARNELLTETGHLCLQEDPPAVAASAWRFLQTLAVDAWGDRESILAGYASLGRPSKL